MIVACSTYPRSLSDRSTGAFLYCMATLITALIGKGKLPTLIRLKRCLAQLKCGPPPNTDDEHVLRRWLDRHRSVGRGDWDNVLEHILAPDAADPSPTESASKAGSKLAATTAETESTAPATGASQLKKT